MMTMKMYTAGVLAVISMFIVPAAAAAQTSEAQVISALEAQTQALLAKVAQLQAQLGVQDSGSNTSGFGTAAATNVSATGAGVGAYGTTGGTVDSSACPNIGRSLKKGVSGDDVRRLQQFLAEDPTVYPEGLVTGYYGALTEAAVRRWQAKYQVVSSGTPETTGYGVVGPRTAAAIALLCSTRAGGSANSNPSVGGYIQVSPISGAAPLTVTITATVNTAGSCAGATYTLDFGDRTTVQNIPVSTGNCKEVAQTFTHTYQYGGVYQIVLSAGGHRTTATVQVSGPLPPSNPTTPTTPQVSSFSVSPSSGPAPLQSVFYTWIPAARPANAGSYQINFGDGAVVQPPFCSQTDTCQTPGQSAHIYANPGTYTAQLIHSSLGVVGSAAITVSSPAPATSTPTTTPAVTGSYGIISIMPLTSTTGDAGITTAFSVPVCAPYQIDWGDGTPVSTVMASCTPNSSLGVTLEASHAYTAAGSYTVALRDGTGAVRSSAGVSISL